MCQSLAALDKRVLPQQEVGLKTSRLKLSVRSGMSLSAKPRLYRAHVEGLPVSRMCGQDSIRRSMCSVGVA